ncbi:glycosyltransferase family 4 protein [Legionella sp. WA2022007384]
MKNNILFFLDFFPQKTETFIHNELIELRKNNIQFCVVALKTIRGTTRPELKAILEQSYYCTKYSIWLKGFFIGLQHPVTFFKNIAWVWKLKHKNILYRFRVITALLVAYGIKNYVLEKNIDYLHAHFASYPTEVVMCLSRITGIPFGATWHAYDIYRDGNIIPEKILYAEQILTCTQFNLDHIKMLSKEQPQYHNRLKRVYHGVNIENLPPSQLIQEDAPFLAVGRLIPKKGFRYLIDAIGLLKSQGLIIHLNIVGFTPFLDRILCLEDNETKVLLKKIKFYGLEDQVKLLGYLPHSEVFTLMNKSYALIMPSIQDKKRNMDGIPNVILEAMATGRPIIASQISGIPEVVIPKQTGILVEPKNITELAQAIATLKNDLVLTREMGDKAQDFIMTHFKLEKTMQECLSCFAPQEIA